MFVNFNGLLFLAGYLFFFFGVLWGVLWWYRKRRQTRHPLPENVKLLRMPGEYLWRRVIEHDEADLQWFAAASLLPILASGGVLYVFAKFFRSSLSLGLLVCFILLLVSMLFSMHLLQHRLQRRADDYLGFFGERYVAEWLDPLKMEGWFVFHDVPCEGATGKFNIDHVAVGPGGVWLIETKTRRKGRARPGFKDHEVVFEGGPIIWPWCDDTECLNQAWDNVGWLVEWLEKMTGKVFDIAAVLAFPGYYVIEKKLGPIRVANPKRLPEVLISRGIDVLNKQDIDLIRRQLEEKCRDVEY